MASSSHSNGQPTVIIAPATSTSGSGAGQQPSGVISKRNLQNLVKFVDSSVQLDDEVEDLLLSYSDEFMDQVIEGACRMAAHRKAGAVELQDLEAYLERSHNIWISNEVKEDEKKPGKKIPQSDAHKQRLALIKKSMKKY